MLALRVAQAGGDRASQPAPLDPAAVSLNEDAARMDAGLTPLYDIPRLDKIKIDGKGDDWGNRGFRVNILANTSGKVQPSTDIDASFRLGWNDRGLLVLVAVKDRKPPAVATFFHVEIGKERESGRTESFGRSLQYRSSIVRALRFNRKGLA